MCKVDLRELDTTYNTIGIQRPTKAVERKRCKLKQEARITRFILVTGSIINED